MRARSKYQVNARLAAPWGTNTVANSGERQSKPAGAGCRKISTGGNLLNHTEDVGVDRGGKRHTVEFFVK